MGVRVGYIKREGGDGTILGGGMVEIGGGRTPGECGLLLCMRMFVRGGRI